MPTSAFENLRHVEVSMQHVKGYQWRGQTADCGHVPEDGNKMMLFQVFLEAVCGNLSCKHPGAQELFISLNKLETCLLT